MRSAFIPLALLSLTAPIFSQAQALKSEDDKTLYAMGMVVAGRFHELGLSPHEADMVKKGFTDALTAGKKPEVEVSAYEQKIQELAKTRVLAKAGERKKSEQAFYDKAAAEKGVEKTASGLLFSSITPGNGASPKPSDLVKVHYSGKLTNGTEFDSSYKRNQPAEFPLNGVIPCWTEGLQKMKVGGKAKLVCPSSIAYGDQGHPPVIPGGATLVFEVELLDIKK